MTRYVCNGCSDEMYVAGEIPCLFCSLFSCAQNFLFLRYFLVREKKRSRCFFLRYLLLQEKKINRCYFLKYFLLQEKKRSRCFFSVTKLIDLYKIKYHSRIICFGLFQMSTIKTITSELSTKGVQNLT